MVCQDCPLIELPDRDSRQPAPNNSTSSCIHICIIWVECPTTLGSLIGSWSWGNWPVSLGYQYLPPPNPPSKSKISIFTTQAFLAPLAEKEKVCQEHLTHEARSPSSGRHPSRSRSPSRHHDGPGSQILIKHHSRNSSSWSNPSIPPFGNSLNLEYVFKTSQQNHLANCKNCSQNSNASGSSVPWSVTDWGVKDCVVCT